MKPAERDELLVRVDERVENIERTTDKQEKHLANLNQKVAKNVLNIDRNYNRINTLEELCEKLIESGVPLRLTRKQVASGGTGVISIIVMLLVALGKTLGWW